MAEYLISEWAIVRRNEINEIPDNLNIHKNFLEQLSYDEFESAFRQIRDLVCSIMTDISENPQQFGMPLAREDETSYGKPIAQESRYAAFRPMQFLNLLFRNGEVRNGCLHVDTTRFAGECKIKNTHMLIKAWEDYGFDFEGLKKRKNFKRKRLDCQLS